MQELVVGLLLVMGYKTIVSFLGSDSRKDVTASPDGLGLEDPVIILELEHRINSSMSASGIRNFKRCIKEI